MLSHQVIQVIIIAITTMFITIVTQHFTPDKQTLFKIKDEDLAKKHNNPVLYYWYIV
jgi:hypothetical protein